MTGVSYFTATLVNSEHDERSGANTISSTGSKCKITNISSDAVKGKWYYYKFVVPKLGSILKGTFSVG